MLCDAEVPDASMSIGDASAPQLGTTTTAPRYAMAFANLGYTSEVLSVVNSSDEPPWKSTTSGRSVAPSGAYTSNSGGFHSSLGTVAKVTSLTLTTELVALVVVGAVTVGEEALPSSDPLEHDTSTKPTVREQHDTAGVRGPLTAHER